MSGTSIIAKISTSLRLSQMGLSAMFWSRMYDKYMQPDIS